MTMTSLYMVRTWTVALSIILTPLTEAGDPASFAAKLAAANKLPAGTEPWVAVETWKQVCQATEGLGPRYAWPTAEAHVSFGVALRSANLHDQALQALEQARAHAESATPSSFHPGDEMVRVILMGMRFHLGDLYDWMGQAEKAIVIYRELLAMPGLEEAYRAGVLSRLGNDLYQTGNSADAELSYEEGLEIYRRLPQMGPESLQCGFMLNALGDIYTMQLRAKMAQDSYAEALAISRLPKEKSPESRSIATTARQGLAYFRANEGKFAEARSLLRANVEEWRGYPDRVLLATRLLEAARIGLRCGPIEQSAARARECRPMINEALEILSAEMPPDHPTRVVADLIDIQNLAGTNDPTVLPRLKKLFALTSSKPSLREHRDAVEIELFFWHMRRSEVAELEEVADGMFKTILKKSSSMILRLGTEDHLPHIWGNNQTLCMVLGTSHFLRDGKLPDMALEWVLNSKAFGGHLEAMRAEAWNLSTEPAVAAARWRWSMAVTALATVETGGVKVSPEQAAALRHDVDAKEQQLVRLLTGKVSPPSWQTVPQIQGSLLPGQALIEFIRYPIFDSKAMTFGVEQYVAWIVKRDGEPKRVVLGSAAAVDAANQRIRREIVRFENAFASPKLTEASKIELQQSLDDALRSLSVDFLAPLWPELDQISSLAIAPVGSLAGVPWDAVPLPSGDRLLERFSTVLLRTGRDLDGSFRSPGGGTPAVFVCSPDYDLGASRNDIRWRRDLMKTLEGRPLGRSDATRIYWEKLAPADHLAVEVTGSINRRFGDCKLLTGPEATEASVKKLQRPLMLAFHTHGYSFSRVATGGLPFTRPQQGPRSLSFGVTAAPLENSFAANLAPKPPLTPSLFDCGLVLASANQRQPLKANAEDGVLSGREITAIDLTGTRLVVLGACETGLGDEVSGEGARSLSHAFILAGAGHVVSTLWKVPEAETESLLKKLFGHLSAGEDGWSTIETAKALREAKLDLIRSRPTGQALHPYFYAGFQLGR